jgi:hypothetical protein
MYWLSFFEEARLIDSSKEAKLYEEMTIWNANLNSLEKTFTELCSSSLTRFYALPVININYPVLSSFMQALLILIPSSAFNEQVNSILGMIRNKHRQAMQFDTVRALVLTKLNHDLLNLNNKAELERLQDKYKNLKQPKQIDKKLKRQIIDDEATIPEVLLLKRIKQS